MSDFEHKHMNKLKELISGVNLWLRYADNVFATLNDKEHAERCLQFLNNQHINIKFTIEHEENI